MTKLEKEIGRFSYHFDINAPLGGRLTVGNFCSIAANLTIVSGIHPSSVANNPNDVSTFDLGEMFMGSRCKCINGQTHVCVGNDVWIGHGVTFVNSVTVGDGAIIGAGSVIRKDIPPYAVVIGNPATIKRYRFNEEQIKALLTIKWWNWDNATIKARVEDFKDIDKFIQKYGVIV